MASFKILGRFAQDAIAAVLPPDYRGLVPMVTKPGVTYTVALFSHDRDKGGVSTSSAVRRALDKIPNSEWVLAVGHDFTVEATALLSTRNASVARIGEFGWTDDSYRSLHTRAS